MGEEERRENTLRGLGKTAESVAAAAGSACVVSMTGWCGSGAITCGGDWRRKRRNWPCKKKKDRMGATHVGRKTMVERGQKIKNAAADKNNVSRDDI